MAKWEYRVIEFEDEEADQDRTVAYEAVLNALGDEGWELVSVTETEYVDALDPDDEGIASGATVAYLKREKA